MPELFSRNALWEVHMSGNTEKDLFMNTVFQGTSLLWAYNMISPWAGAAKADIWRYAVLWTYGGAYIDDDSDMRVPLDKVVEPLDELIVSYERNGYNGDGCYIPRYKLSDFHALGRNATAKAMEIFKGRVLPNWAIISMPRHKIMERTMENVVDIIRQEYLSDPVLRDIKYAPRWQTIMCSTGPSVFTGSAREVVIQNPKGLSYKLAREDFKEYGGKFKAIYVPVRSDPKHYMNQKKTDVTFLLSYLPEKPLTIEDLKAWQGQLVQGQNGREIFVMDQEKRRGIPNMDTFAANNFSMGDVRVISDKKIYSIEMGLPLPPRER